MRWRMKTVRNDELRQRFVDRFAPAALDLGLKIHVVTKDEHGNVTIHAREYFVRERPKLADDVRWP